jgi:hypothetical protein
MSPTLSPEMLAAVNAAGDVGVELVDPVTHKLYVLVSREVHTAAMNALRREDDRNAIVRGLSEIDRGEGIPLDAAAKMLRAHAAEANS